MLSALSLLIEGRNSFFHRVFNRLGSTTRDNITSRFMINELCYMEMLNRIHQHHLRNTAAATALLTTLNLPHNFTEPVTVAPSQIQIDRATQVVVEPPAHTRCAICQDDVVENATQIRQCGHMYHASCFTQWFGMSVRCPVCRHDIRTDPAAQTPPGSE